jgi:hypothetical protein
MHKFEKWCTFLSCVKAKSCKKISHKMRPACILYLLAKIFHECSPASSYHLQYTHYIPKSAIHLCCSYFSSCVCSCMTWMDCLLQWTDMSKKLKAQRLNFDWIRWEHREMSVDLCDLRRVIKDLKNSIHLKHNHNNQCFDATLHSVLNPYITWKWRQRQQIRW